MKAFIEQLGHPDYLHVLLNPIPGYCLIMAVGILALAMLRKNRGAELMALWGIVFSCAMAWPVWYFGHKAYEYLEKSLTEEGIQWANVHMHRGNMLIYIFYGTAILALTAIFLPKKFPGTTKPLVWITLLVALGSLGAAGWIAKAGGEIRHSEFRTGPAPPAPQHQKEHGSHEKNGAEQMPDSEKNPASENHPHSEADVEDPHTSKIHLTPARAVGYGATAGLSATLAISLLARLMPASWLRSEAAEASKSPNKKSFAPQHPFNAGEVEQWEDKSRSPAAYIGEQSNIAQATSVHTHDDETALAVTPAGVLAQTLPGPEGAAEEFARKVASGIFSRDISHHSKIAGIAVHIFYGTFCGVVYGIFQGTYHLHPLLFGSAFGFGLWLLGPAILVPAMGLMRSLKKEKRSVTALILAGNIIYGVLTAFIFEALK